MTKWFYSDRLGVRLVLASLLVGSVLSIFSTSVQLIASFNRQKSDVTQVLDQIDMTLADALELALWTFDFDQVNIVLDGLASNEAITHIELVSQTGHSWERGVITPDPVQRIYELSYAPNGLEEEYLGQLQVDLSLDKIVDRVWAQFWVTLLTNLAKAYLAAFALLFIVHRMITRHLRNIAGYVAGSDVEKGLKTLQLNRPPHAREDDLDHIVHAIQQYDARVATSVSDLKTEIEERIKSETQAREALSIRTSFIGTMSHEVRTPLNAILGFLHLIEIDASVPERQRHYARVATKASHQLLNQLTNVLEMSRLDSNAVSISTRPTDIRRLAQQWQDTTVAAVHFHQKDIDVTLDIDPKLDEKYMLDGARVTQIVTNLTDNAAKFTHQGGICIALHTVPMTHEGRDTHGIEISVADSGPGIDDVQRARIFHRFTQINDGLERSYGGTGLGLAICLEMSELMGAELSVRSAEKDGFTTEFLITLGCNVRQDEQNE